MSTGTRVGYLGPEGSFSHAAALTAPSGPGFEPVGFETIHETVLAVHNGLVERAVVPIENSIEGSVRTTLDALVFDAENVNIVAETILEIEQCLIAREQLPLADVEVVLSHPQATAQCRAYIQANMPQARVMTSSSTAEAVRLVSERIRHRWAAIGMRLAADLYGCVVLAAGIEDAHDNQTRFVWLARSDADGRTGTPAAQAAPDAGWKTAAVFWGSGAESPGWLVGCLSELAFRGVNMTRIESRPLREGLGSYMFFIDLDGRSNEANVAEALTALRGRAGSLRILGSFPVA